MRSTFKDIWILHVSINRFTCQGYGDSAQIWLSFTVDHCQRWPCNYDHIIYIFTMKDRKGAKCRWSHDSSPKLIYKKFSNEMCNKKCTKYWWHLVSTQFILPTGCWPFGGLFYVQRSNVNLHKIILDAKNMMFIPKAPVTECIGQKPGLDPCYLSMGSTKGH